MDWSKNKGLLRLADIYIYDNDGYWAGWNILDLLVRLDSQKSLLLSLLSSLALVHHSKKDQWGWGHDGYYSTANAFKFL